MGIWQRRLLVLLLVVVCYALWRPVRTQIARHTVGPLVRVLSPADIVIDTSSRNTVSARSDASETLNYRTPGGIRVLLGLLVLAAMGVSRSWILAFVLAHVALGLISLLAFIGSTNGVEVFAVVQAFLDSYLLNLITLGFMTFALIGKRSDTPRGSSSGEQTTKVADGHA